MTPIEAKVYDVIAEELCVERLKLVPTTRLEADLGADSLDHVELVMACEKEFDLDIPDQDAEQLKTVGDFARYMAARIEQGVH